MGKGPLVKGIPLLSVAISVVVGLGGCAGSRRPARPVSPPSVSSGDTELRQWQVAKLLAEQPSVQIALETPAYVTLHSYGASQEVFDVATALGKDPYAGILAVPIMVLVLPALVIHSESESKIEKQAQTELSDPIFVVRKKLRTALRAEHSLADVRWTDGPCPTCSVVLKLRTTKREICAPFWSTYAAELEFAESSGTTSWRTGCVSVDPKPPSASGPPGEIQKYFDELASACADQLVTALLGRGRALPPAPLPWACP